MIFKQLYDPATGTLSYLLGDPIGSEAALVDPVPDQAPRYRELLRTCGLRLRHLVETRLPDTHPSASPGLREETGARLALHRAEGAACADRFLEHGDRLHFGEETVAVLHVPGVSPGAVALHWGDRLLTGDTLLVGRLGCPAGDRGDSDSLCASVHRTLLALPADTLVLPGRDRDGRRVSSLAQEVLTNPDLEEGPCAERLRMRCR